MIKKKMDNGLNQVTPGGGGKRIDSAKSELCGILRDRQALPILSSAYSTYAIVPPSKLCNPYNLELPLISQFTEAIP